MIKQDYAITMAHYNAWQNENMASSMASLSAAELEKDRGAFFGSILQTASHLLWGDTFWMSRFSGSPAPNCGIEGSLIFAASWDDYRPRRQAQDQAILQWTKTMDQAWLQGELCWFSGTLGREVCKPTALLLMHFFNHQTHHRGQIHAMLTAAGADTQATDLPFMPEAFATL
ncbi:MAG: DinB family protein [Devosiaceae bacterium]